MPSLLNAAKYIAVEYGFTPQYLDDPMFSDPILPASQGETLETLHLLMCCATGDNPLYINLHRVISWVSQAGKAANA